MNTLKVENLGTTLGIELPQIDKYIKQFEYTYRCFDIGNQAIEALQLTTQPHTC